MSSFEPDFSGWLSDQQSLFCNACGEALDEGIAQLSADELDSANRSLNNIYADTSSGSAFPGGDCNYALPGTGPLYTGHWHGKRVHDGLSVLVPLLPILSARRLGVIDVGAGTGAALWAWTLLACYKQACGSPVPVHSWYSVDSSQSMLTQGDRLWEKLCGVLPNGGVLVNRQAPAIGDWRSPSALPTDAVVVGSYLFSRADLNNPAATAAAFVAFLGSINASGIVLWTKPNKSAVQDGVKTRLAAWMDHTPPQLFDCPLQGRMWRCWSAARSRFTKVNLSPDPEWDRRFNWGRAPTDVARLALTRP